MTLSLATFAIRRYGSIDDLAAHISGLALEAKAQGSRAILLPEMANVGLLWTDPACASLAPKAIGGAYERILTPLFTPYCAAMSDIARQHDIAIIGASYWHKTGGVGTNSAFVFFPDGRVHRQDKIHPTRPELAIDTRGGTNIGLFEIDGIKAAVLICYDIQFPELVRPLVDGGVRLIFVPSLTSRRGYWRVRYGSHARAQENQIYVCVSPLFGDLGIPAEHPLQAHGGSYVTCPIDNRLEVEDGLLAHAPADVEGLLTVDLDFETLSLSREKGEIRPLKDRRPDVYAQLKVS